MSWSMPPSQSYSRISALFCKSLPDQTRQPNTHATPIPSAIFSLAKGAIHGNMRVTFWHRLKDCVLSANFVDFLGTDPADVDLSS